MTKNNRGKDGRFFNPWHEKLTGRFLHVLKWLLFSKNPYKEEKKKPVRFELAVPDFGKLEASGKDYIVWLGHSTALISLNKKVFITDPVFWDVHFFIKRKTPLPIDPMRLPHIDYVLISHGHYDHLNTKSVRFLKERFDPVFVSGRGFDGYFKSLKISRHMCLDWWDEADLEGVKLTALPVQHWSKRSLFDTNKMLWAGFLLEKNGKKLCWLGDTGYYEGFKEIGRRFGPIDVLLAPIGAYEPRWFMQWFHINPDETLRVAADVRARVLIPIHWGTFDLSDEPLWMPVQRLKEVYENTGGLELKILLHGGQYVME